MHKIFSWKHKRGGPDVSRLETAEHISAGPLETFVPLPPSRPGIPVNRYSLKLMPEQPSIPSPMSESSSGYYAHPPDQPNIQDGLPMIPKVERSPPLPSGVRSLYISVLRKSNHVRVHHRLGVRNDMTDKELFALIRDGYNTHLLGFWRRWFTLKGLKSIGILECVDNKQPVPLELDDFVLQEIMFAYSNPEKITSERDWVNWAFRLKQNDKRFALDFIEGWRGSRIIILGLIPWITSFLMAIVWSSSGGDVQTVFTVASFVLTAASSLLALLAIVSALES